MDSAFPFLMVSLGWFLGGIAGGATGLGAIMIALPIMMLALPAGDAILVTCLVGAISTPQLYLLYRKWTVWSDVWPLVLGILPGAILGTLALKITPVAVLQLILCGFIILFIALQVYGKASSWTLPDSRAVAAGVGLICGFIHSSVAVSGVPVGIYTTLKHWDPNRARGNMSLVYVFTSCGAVVMQASAGLYRLDFLPVTLAGIAASLIGQRAGVCLGRNINQNLFRRIILTILAITAVILFCRALG